MENKYLCLFISLITIFSASCGNINSEHFEGFSSDGYVTDSLDVFQDSVPSNVKFFVEASGSMNGFFRSNQGTCFKRDVWSVVSHYPNVNRVYLFDKTSNNCSIISVDDFRLRMNAGNFVTSISTDIRSMIQTTIDSTCFEKGEVAVLISDMKYDQEGKSTKAPLMEQYASDIRNIFSKHPYAISLVCATSEFISKNGQVICEESPYYYLLIGKSEQVLHLRTELTDMLRDSYGGIVELGINYGSPKFIGFSQVENAFQLDQEPTLYNFDTEFCDTCRFTLNIDISHLPIYYKGQDKDYLMAALQYKTLRGSKFTVDSISCENLNDRKNNSQKRIAHLFCNIYNMIYSNSDLVELSVIPQLVNTKKNIVFDDGIKRFLVSDNPNDVYSTYSLENFIDGASQTLQSYFGQKPLSILISKNK